MSRYFQRVFFLILIASLNSCSYLATYQLIGVWRVVEIFEDNKLLRDRTIENIILQFNDEGQYTFKGTLNYKEAGNFKVKRNLLVLFNKLSNEEKNLYIDALNSKKLVLLMENTGKVRKMVFKKTFK